VETRTRRHGSRACNVPAAETVAQGRAPTVGLFLHSRPPGSGLTWRTRANSGNRGPFQEQPNWCSFGVTRNAIR
jgi:hypothetical protein